MAYPQFYPFKTKYLQASTTSSNTISSTVVPARAKLLGAWYAPTPVASHTAVGTATVAVNGTSVTGMSAITVTTSTGDSATNLGSPTVDTYLNAGDVLSTLCSSVTGGVTQYILREF